MGSSIIPLAPPGYNRSLLRDAVVLIAEASWSTTGVEQGHGSMAMLHRFHPDYSSSTICARALVHQLRNLFATPPEVKQQARTQTKLDKHDNKCPEKQGGRHAFLADCYASVAAELPAGTKLSNSLRKRVFQTHAEVYANLPLHIKEKYQAVAAETSAAKRRKLNEDIIHLRGCLKLQKIRLQEEITKHGRQCVLGHCRFSIHDMDTMTQMMGSPEYSSAAVSELRHASALSTLEAPSDEKQVLLGSFPVYDGKAKGYEDMPDWAITVCRHREHFRLCALTAESQGSCKAYAVLFAVKSPFLLSLAPLHRVERAIPYLTGVSMRQLLELQDTIFEHDFILEWGHTTSDMTGIFTGMDNIMVIPGLGHLQGGRVCSHCDAVSLQDFVKDLPKPSRSKRTTPAKEPVAKVSPELMQTYPWLQQFSESLDNAKAAGDTSTDLDDETSAVLLEPAHDDMDGMEEGFVEAFIQSPGVAASSMDMTSIEADALETALQALQTKRSSWEHEDKLETTDFETWIKGGSWKQQHRGSGTDSTMARACSEVSTAWCKLYGLQKSTSFSHKKFGEEAAACLALAWCHRMQFFYNIYKLVDTHGYVYCEDDWTSYQEDESFSLFCQELATSSPAYERVGQLMATHPHRPLSGGLAGSRAPHDSGARSSNQ